MSIVNGLLAQTTNHLFLVVPGLMAWGLAYWQLDDLGPETLGDVVILILTVIPLGIGVIAIDVGWARWNGYKHILAVVFILLGAVAIGYFIAIYFGRTKVGNASAVRRVLKAQDVFSETMPKTVGKVLMLLAGVILTLACVGLLIFGGWQLIQGSWIIGLMCGLGGLALVVLLHYPPQKWNLVRVCYSTLKERKTDLGHGGSRQPAAKAESHPVG